jgi:hypothetical protein
MKPADVLSYASAAAAFLAAAFWLCSARVKIPGAIRHIDGGHILETTPKEPDDLDKLTAGLVLQSRLSAVAAAFAAAAAILQALATLLTA